MGPNDFACTDYTLHSKFKVMQGIHKPHRDFQNANTILFTAYLIQATAYPIKIQVSIFSFCP